MLFVAGLPKFYLWGSWLEAAMPEPLDYSKPFHHFGQSRYGLNKKDSCCVASQIRWSHRNLKFWSTPFLVQICANHSHQKWWHLLQLRGCADELTWCGCGCPGKTPEMASLVVHHGIEMDRNWNLQVIWGFPKIGVPWGTPIAGWFIREHPTKMDDLGVPPLQETSICEYLFSHDFPSWRASHGRHHIAAQQHGGRMSNPPFARRKQLGLFPMAGGTSGSMA